MKAAVFALACVLLAGSAFAGRSLSQFGTTSCSAYGSLSVIVKHGTCSGIASANCTAISEFDALIQSDIKPGVTFDFCDPVVVEAEIETIVDALASVYVDSLSKVTCENGSLGFGCAFSLASGDSFATAFSQSFAKAVGAALSDKLSSVCVADLTALAAGVADVAADANTNACVFGTGSAEAFRSRFVENAITVLTKAVATVTAEICDEGADTATCEATVEGSSIFEENPTDVETGADDDTATPGNTSGGSTNASDDSTKIKPCEGEKKTCCSGVCPFGVLGADLTGEHNLVLLNSSGVALCWCH